MSRFNYNFCNLAISKISTNRVTLCVWMGWLSTILSPNLFSAIHVQYLKDTKSEIWLDENLVGYVVFQWTC